MVSLRRLTPEDIDAALKLSDAEKWNQTENDWNFLIGSPGNICLAAIEGGKIVGTATATIYNNEVAWIGMVLVEKGFRGKGISKLLLFRLLEKLNHCLSVKLDATPAGQPVYEKFGFREEYRILRMIHPSGDFTETFGVEKNVISMSKTDVPNVVAFDQQVFGADRMKLIEFLYHENLDNSWIVKSGEGVAGLVLGREGARYYQVGPLSAASLENTKILIRKALENVKGKPIVIDVLEEKKELVSWLGALGFVVQRPFTRMFHHENANPGIRDYQYLICGPEFG